MKFKSNKSITNNGTSSAYDTPERSIPNPLHYFGKFCMAGGGLMVIPLVAITALSSGFTADVMSTRSVELDNKGTVMEESVMSYHRDAFNKLEDARFALDSVAAENSIHQELGVLSEAQKDETRDLITAFSEQAKLTTLDLYLKGVNLNDTPSEKAGAAISENSFRDFYLELRELTNGYETIQSNIGMDNKILTASLDECIASSDLSQSDEYLERYKDMKEINSCMVDESYRLSDDNMNGGFIVLGIFTGVIGGIAGFGFGGEAASNLPKRIPLGRKKSVSAGRH